MRAIMVMYDSLNRKYLESCGCSWTLTPNFKRLAERAVQFENSWVGSLPCMPARRELQTGRANFLHRSWGPMEPFDDSVPEILKNSGVYTHICSDHQHYWEDGGCTYHTRFSSWEISRGQEGDPWQADLKIRYDGKSIFEGAKAYPDTDFFRNWRSRDERNRAYMDTEEKTSQAVTFAQGARFIRQNHDEDKWFLQIETFDPHEPFYSLPGDRALFPDCFCGDGNDDWPTYGPVLETPEAVEHVRHVYAALLAKCDRYLGKVLDLMDKYDMWKDTLLIVNTDHGFLLGEHGWWGKSIMPCYEEIAHTPLYVWDPRFPETAGRKRHSLVQTVDLAATLLEFFGRPLPPAMEGRPLRQVIENDAPIREAAVYGYHGSDIYATDGRFLYQLAPVRPEEPVYEYTLMPTHMRAMFSPEELQGMQLQEPFSFTRGCRTMKIPARQRRDDPEVFATKLYDLQADPLCEAPIRDAETEARLKAAIRAFMDRNDAPAEVYRRFGMD